MTDLTEWQLIAEARGELVRVRDQQIADRDRQLAALHARIAVLESQVANGAGLPPEEWAAIERVARDYSFGNSKQYLDNLEHARGLRRTGLSGEEIIAAIERGGSARPVLGSRTRGVT